MQINIITAFPNFYDSFFNTSLIATAIKRGVLNFNVVDLKDFGIGKYKKVDDTPYGGGAGMVLRVDCIDNALKSIKNKGLVCALTPKGKTFTQNQAVSFSKQKAITLICGRYEGFDERVFSLVDKKISIGQFITMGGEAPSLCVIEAMARNISGVIGNSKSVIEESFSNKNIEYPIYTKPNQYNGKSVPSVLLSGNHKKIKEWREKKTKNI